MRRFFLRAVCLLVPAVVSSFSPSVLAQEADPQEEKPQGATPYRGAQYFLGAEDELLMRVNIWGFVKKPGQYMVPTDTDLISLMSFAGGPVEQAKIKSIKIIHASNSEPDASANNRTLETRANQSPLHPLDSTPARNDPRRQQVLKVNVKEYLKTGAPGLIPPLMPGDTIVVEGSSFNSVSKVLDFASKVAVIAQIYFWVTVANNR